MLLSCQNEMFRADHNYIKEMQINWENFVIVRGKKKLCRDKTHINDIFISPFFNLLFGFVSKMFSSGSFCCNNCKCER